MPFNVSVLLMYPRHRSSKQEWGLHNNDHGPLAWILEALLSRLNDC